MFFKFKPNAEQIGIYREHQYALTDVIEVNKMRIVKIHNPHNIADKIKGFEAFKIYFFKFNILNIQYN